MITNKYLPLKRGHIIPIVSLSPEDFKKSSNLTIKDREDVSHNTLLNAMASAVGCIGGYSNYVDFYSQKILPFLQRNNLKRPVNIFKNASMYGVDSAQGLSERIFYSDLPIPEKIYIDRKNESIDFHAPSGHQWFARLDTNESALHKVLCKFYKYQTLEYLKEINSFTAESQIVKESSLSLQEVREKVLSLNVWYLFNIGLLDDTLCLPNISMAEPKIYNCSNDSEKLKVAEIYKMYSKFISERKNQWYSILPFNDKLCFIVGQNGEYDFLFKNQRDNSFKHIDDYTGLAIKDLPNSMKGNYLFDRWFYFEYEGVRAYDKHMAEHHFYENGGTGQGWTEKIYSQYYIDKKVYIPNKISKANSLPFLHEVVVDGRKLMISDLITIDDINSFLDRKPEYLSNRDPSLDSLLASNMDSDLSLPASCNWVDVLSYIKDLEERFQINFRLLTLNEFKEIRKRGSEEKMYSHWESKYHSDPEYQAWYECYRPIYKLDGQLFKKSQYIDPSIFQENVEIYFNGIEFDKTSDQLTFVTSPFFAEWLMGETCIRTADLSSFGYGNTDLIPRDKVPSQSNGKYKDLKIGFRLCYEV